MRLTNLFFHKLQYALRNTPALFFLLLACALSSRAFAQTLTWTGALDGKTFTLAGNWSPNTAPGPSNDCVIGPGPGTIELNNNTSVKSLTIGRNMFIGPCLRLTLTSGLTLTNNSIVTIENTGGCAGLDFNGGVQQLAGNGEIAVMSAGYGSAAIYLHNNASVTFAAGITVRFGPGSNWTSATITIDAGSTLMNFGTIAVRQQSRTFAITGAGRFENHGTVEAASGIMKIETASWVNYATIEATNATLIFANAWSNAGSVFITNTTWNIGGTAPGLGTVIRTGGTIQMTATFTSGSLVAGGSIGDIDISSVTLTGVALQSTAGGKFTTSGSTTLDNCSIQANIEACGTVTVKNGLTFAGGALLNFKQCSSVLSVTGGPQSISGNGRIAIQGVVNVGGSSALTIESGVPISDDSGSELTFSIGSASTLINKSVISKPVYGPLLITGTGTFKNQGSVAATDSASLKINILNWSNEGTISSDGQSLALEGSWTNSASMAFRNCNPGQVSGTWTNSGTIVFESVNATLSGSWSSTGTIDARASSVRLAQTWANAGILKSLNSSLIFDGTYSTFGTLQRTGGSLILNGVYTASVLEANALTGDLTLGNVRLTSCTLKSSGGSKLLVTDTPTLAACILANNLTVTECGSVAIATSLTFQNGAKLIINQTQTACNLPGLTVPSGSAVAIGTGEIALVSGSRFISLDSNANLTIWNSVSLSVGPAFAGTSTSIYLGYNANFTNKSTIALNQPAATLTIEGIGNFKNQGSLNISGGKFILKNLSGNLGNFTLAPGAKADITGSSYSIDAPISISDHCELTLGGSYTLNHPIAVSGNSTLTLNGTAVVNQPITVSGDSSLVINANCTINQAIDVVGGIFQISGTWTNNAQISASQSNIRLAGTWSNAGSIVVTDSTLTVSGTYTSLGSHSFANSVLTYSGTYPAGQPLVADASTGDITIANASFVNSTLRTRDGRKIVIGFGPYTLLNSCTLDGQFVHGGCGRLQISGGIYLVTGTTIRLSNQCNEGVRFIGSPQVISGSGEIYSNDFGSTVANLLIAESSLTISSGIRVRVGPDSTGTGMSKIYIYGNSILTNYGTLIMEAPGREFAIVDGVLKNQGTIEAAAGNFRIYPSSIANIASNTLNGGIWRATGGTISFDISTIRALGTDAQVFIHGPQSTIPQLSGLNANAGFLSIAGRAVSITPFSTGIFANTGTVELAPDASLLVTGRVALQPAGTFRTFVGGLADNQVGRINATVSATLEGKLQGTFIAPFIPTAGDATAPVITSPALSGSFSSVCFEANPQLLGAFSVLDTASSPNAFSLFITPDSGLSPYISNQPTDASASPNATFTVAAAPINATYQWRKSTTPLSNGPTGSGSIVSGAQSPTLTITNAQPADIGTYTVRITNPCSTITSKVVHLRICPGDLNNDGLVNDADFTVFAISYNILDCSDPAMPANCPGDLNADTLVDDADFSRFVVAYDEFLCP